MRLIRIGSDGGESWTVDADNMVVGRAPARGRQIAGGTNAREHARLLQRVGEWNVADLNSSNGTFVNGARVTRSALAQGDVLKLGSVELRVETSDAVPNLAGSGAAGSAPSSSAESAGEITLEDADRLFETIITPARPAAAAPPSAPPAPSRPISTQPLTSRATTSSGASRGGKTSVIRADLAQYGLVPRLLLVLLALAIAYGAFVLVSRVTEDVVPDAPASDTGAPASEEGN